MGELDLLGLVFAGIALNINNGDVDSVIGVTGTIDSEIADDEDAIVDVDKIGCSGKMVEGVLILN